MIIVIAIMAILIGVIALAVIPNIQRSRESKDLTTLDNILSAANTAVANAKISFSGTDTETIVLTKANSYACPADTAKVTGFKAMFDEAMAGTISLGSAPVTDQSINIKLSKGKIEVYISPKANESKQTINSIDVAECARTQDDVDSSKKAAYYVSN